MSLDGLNNLVQDWTLNNSLTINDAVVEGDLNTTGFIYGGGVTFNLLSSNNTWTGENTYSNYLPTYLLPSADTHMDTKQYADTTFNNIGNNLLPLNNTWTGSNTFNALPKVNSNASSGDQVVNKNTADNSVSSYTGSLNTANNWTGNNYFNTSVVNLSVPTPTADTHIANKGYVDTAIANFNATGGKVELFEYQNSGNLNITCDPTLYSSMIVCMVSGGGYGNVNTTPTASSTISYGGSGGMIVWKMPAFTGNALYQAVYNTRTTIGFSKFFYTDSTTLLFSITNGGNGSQSVSGNGGNINYRHPKIAVDQNQIIRGTSKPLQNPITNPNIYRTTNIACYNGFGMGGSFNFSTGADFPPTNNYLLLIRFRN